MVSRINKSEVLTGISNAVISFLAARFKLQSLTKKSPSPAIFLITSKTIFKAIFGIKYKIGELQPNARNAIVFAKKKTWFQN